MTLRIGRRIPTRGAWIVTLLLAARPLSAAAGASARTVVCVDHSSHVAAMSDDDSEQGCRSAITAHSQTPLETGAEVAVDTGRRLGVRVLNTNTALFSYEVTEERIVAKDREALQGFLKAFGPYALDLPVTPKALDKEARPDIERMTPADQLGLALLALDGLVDGLHQVEAMRANALLELRADPGRAGHTLLVALVGKKLVTTSRDDNPGWPDRCAARWPDLRLSALNSKGLAGTYATVARLLATLLKTPAYDEGLAKSAREALADQQGVMDAAYTLEGLISRTTNASDQWCWSDGPEVRSSHGHKLSLDFAPFDRPEAAQLADQSPYKLALEVQPRWVFRPGVGLSLIYSKNSVYPTYEAKALDDTTFVPTQTGEQDARLTYGLTLGFSWRILERILERRGARDWAVWFPEVSVNADSDSRSVGAGVAFSWKALKLGAGYAWTKHTVLANGLVAEETILTSAADLRTRSSYAPGKFYVSLSLIGWQPFSSK